MRRPHIKLSKVTSANRRFGTQVSSSTPLSCNAYRPYDEPEELPAGCERIESWRRAEIENIGAFLRLFAAQSFGAPFEAVRAADRLNRERNSFLFNPLMANIDRI